MEHISRIIQRIRNRKFRPEKLPDLPVTTKTHGPVKTRTNGTQLDGVRKLTKSEQRRYNSKMGRGYLTDDEIRQKKIEAQRARRRNQKNKVKKKA